MGSRTMAPAPGPNRRPRANISRAAIPSAIRKLTRRLSELLELEAPKPHADISGMATLIANKINATIDEVFGQGTADAKDFWIDRYWFALSYGPSSWEEKAERFAQGLDRSIASVTNAIERLKEKALDADEDDAGRSLRAYEGLALHPEIARAASDLYRNGHYANAVEAAVKALNALVRLRSELELDGTALMEKAFSPNGPMLKFNDLSDQSDRDEQRGFMMMFSGSVSGLRNPRAHGFVHDDPERALEFIAFVSLLAKLLDEAKKAVA
jgi:uncharacterized protein (TIGR02391 family)